MSEKGEVDLTGAKQNTGVWLVKVKTLVHCDIEACINVKDSIG